MLDSHQFKSGKNVEAFLDEFFRRRGWHIEPTTPYEERELKLGDRRYARGDVTWLVEYKSGVQTFYTGNVFLETISVDSDSTPGWVYTCQADYIFYAAVLNEKILVFKPDALRDQIDDLKAKFREVATSNQQNKGYNTHGVIVPLAYAEQYLAVQVIQT